MSIIVIALLFFSSVSAKSFIFNNSSSVIAGCASQSSPCSIANNTIWIDNSSNIQKGDEVYIVSIYQPVFISISTPVVMNSLFVDNPQGEILVSHPTGLFYVLEVDNITDISTVFSISSQASVLFHDVSMNLGSSIVLTDGAMLHGAHVKVRNVEVRDNAIFTVATDPAAYARIEGITTAGNAELLENVLIFKGNSNFMQSVVPVLANTVQLEANSSAYFRGGLTATNVDLANNSFVLIEKQSNINTIMPATSTKNSTVSFLNSNTTLCMKVNILYEPWAFTLLASSSNITVGRMLPTNYMTIDFTDVLITLTNSQLSMNGDDNLLGQLRTDANSILTVGYVMFFQDAQIDGRLIMTNDATIMGNAAVTIGSCKFSALSELIVGAEAKISCGESEGDIILDYLSMATGSSFKVVGQVNLVVNRLKFGNSVGYEAYFAINGTTSVRILQSITFAYADRRDDVTAVIQGDLHLGNSSVNFFGYNVLGVLIVTGDVYISAGASLFPPNGDSIFFSSIDKYVVIKARKIIGKFSNVAQANTIHYLGYEIQYSDNEVYFVIPHKQHQPRFQLWEYILMGVGGAVIIGVIIGIVVIVIRRKRRTAYEPLN